MIQFGIMGAGNIARKFADAVRQVEGAQVAAVAQRVERLIVRLRDERENLEEKQGQLDWDRERLLTAQNRAQLQSGAETGEAVPV